MDSPAMNSVWKQLAERPDFRKNPGQAIAKRLLWRLRWALRRDAWNLRLDDGSRILAQRGGAGALIFFQKSSDPDTASFLSAFLKPGMVFVDVGANIGEYTLRAARLVGPAGDVHAFEPSPASFTLLQANVAQNGYENVAAVRAALGDSNGTVSLRIEEDPSLNRLDLVSETQPVPCITVDSFRLDSYWAPQNRRIDLIKLDVEGAELLVLRGAERLPGMPVWFFEHSPENCACFGYDPSRILAIFRERGYDIWSWEESLCEPVSGVLDDRDRNLIAAPKGVHPPPRL
jgi:FkbM family methyltransferase